MHTTLALNLLCRRQTSVLRATDTSFRLDALNCARNRLDPSFLFRFLNYVERYLDHVLARVRSKALLAASHIIKDVNILHLQSLLRVCL